MNDRMMPPHIEAMLSDEQQSGRVTGRTMEIVNEVVLAHWGWDSDDLTTDDAVDLGGEG